MSPRWGVTLLSGVRFVNRAVSIRSAEHVLAWDSTEVLACTRICAGSGGGFRGEVGVADVALAGRHVFQRDVQAVDVGRSTSFWNAPSRPRSSATWLIACGDDLLRLDGVAGDQRVGPAAAEAGEEADDAVAQVGGGDGADADVDLPWADHLRAELESRPPPVM